MPPPMHKPARTHGIHEGRLDLEIGETFLLEDLFISAEYLEGLLSRRLRPG